MKDCGSLAGIQNVSMQKCFIYLSLPTRIHAVTRTILLYVLAHPITILFYIHLDAI